MPEDRKPDYERFFNLLNAELDPRFKDFKRAGDAVPEMNTLFSMRSHSLEQAWYDGPSYFRRLMDQMDELIQTPQNAVWWMHGWYFQLFDVESNFKFWGRDDLPSGYQLMEPSNGWEVNYKAEGLYVNKILFAEKLKAMKDVGVDVRIIGWLPPIMFKSQAIVKATNGLHDVVIHGETKQAPSHIFDRNIGTLHSLLMLRNGYLDANKVIFNNLTHPLGGAHTKFVIAGNGTFRRAFIGGIDAGPSRNKPTWSDAAFAIEGTAATKAATFFVQLWNEIHAKTAVGIRVRAVSVNNFVEIQEGSHLTHLSNPMTAVITDITPVTGNNIVDNAFVQLFRTLPMKRYANRNTSVSRTKRYLAGRLLAKKNKLTENEQVVVGEQTIDLPCVWTAPISFAQNGLFEYKRVVLKAIMAAEQYIYIMDQAPSNYEFAFAINKRILELRKQGKYLKVIVLTPIHEDGDLEGGHGELSPEEVAKQKENAVQLKYRKQYSMFQKMAAQIPETEYPRHFVWIDSATHAKVVLIDDKFVTIGSANFMFRSAYTDIEMGAAILHETWVKDFRKGMWAWFCDPAGNVVPDDIGLALRMWTNVWLREGNPSTETLALVPKKDMGKIYQWFVPTFQRGAPVEQTTGQWIKFLAIAGVKPLVEDPDSTVEI